LEKERSGLLPLSSADASWGIEVSPDSDSAAMQSKWESFGATGTSSVGEVDGMSVAEAYDSDILSVKGNDTGGCGKFPEKILGKNNRLQHPDDISLA